MLWLTTLGLAALSVAMISYFTRRTLTVAVFYWCGWLLGIGAATTMSGDGMLPPFTARGQGLLLQLHLGAFAGFVLAALAYHLIVVATLGPRRLATHQREMVDRLHLSGQIVGAALVLQLALGLVTLGYRLQDAGGFSGLSTLMNLRATFLTSTYLVKELPLAVRLSTHLGLMLAPFPFLFAMQDALAGQPRTTRLVLWWLASVPAGLSTGGRGWIIAAPALYAFGYLVTSGDVLNSIGVRRLVRRGSLAVLGMVALFGLIERLRTRDSLSTTLLERGTGSRWYQAVPSLIPVVYYMGLPTLAVDEHAAFAERGPRHGGTLTMPFAMSQLARLGLPAGQGSLGDFTKDVRMHSIRGRYPVLAATHATIVPPLVGDFGEARLPLVMAALCFVMELTFLFLRRRGIVRRFIAVQIVMFGGFWVFQDFGLIQAGAVLPALWLALLAALAWLSHPEPSRRWMQLFRTNPPPRHERPSPGPAPAPALT
jgi:hypothetical protein